MEIHINFFYFVLRLTESFCGSHSEEVFVHDGGCELFPGDLAHVCLEIYYAHLGLLELVAVVGGLRVALALLVERDQLVQVLLRVHRAEDLLLFAHLKKIVRTVGG